MAGQHFTKSGAKQSFKPKNAAEREVLKKIEEDRQKYEVQFGVGLTHHDAELLNALMPHEFQSTKKVQELMASSVIMSPHSVLSQIKKLRDKGLIKSEAVQGQNSAGKKTAELKHKRATERLFVPTETPRERAKEIRTIRASGANGKSHGSKTPLLRMTEAVAAFNEAFELFCADMVELENFKIQLKEFATKR